MRRRNFAVEALEPRALLAATVTSTSFLSSGTLPANSTTITVTFSEPVSFTLGSQQNPATSAKQIKAVNPAAASGVYYIDPNGGAISDAFQVYCDMTTDGGGWMLAVNSVLGSEPSSNDITANTGTVGLTTAQTRNLNSYFAGTDTAEIRHEIDGSNVVLGRFHGKYTADSYQSIFTSFTALAGHTNANLLSGSFGASFGANPGGAAWFYNGNPSTSLPASPSIVQSGPYYLQSGQTLNSYRIWIRESSTPAAPKSIGGAELPANYQLQGADADGVLLGTDAIVNPTTVSMNGNTATLTFPALADDTWRLTVKDTISDESGNAIDGDGNGTAGGNWRRDFVVGSAISSFASSPNGFVFDPVIAGTGAGQFVQGTTGAFDGLGRLKVEGQSVTFPIRQSASTVFGESTTSSATSLTSGAWVNVDGLSSTLTLNSSASVELTTQLRASSGSSVRFLINGVPLETAGSLTGVPVNSTRVSVDPPNTATSADGAAHVHGIDTRSFTMFLGTGQQVSPLDPNYRFFIGPSGSGTSHSHTLDIGAFNSGPTGSQSTTVVDGSLSDWTTLPAGTYTITVQVLGPTGGTVSGKMQAAAFLDQTNPANSNGSQTFMTGVADTGTLTVQREVTVPQIGSHDFARTVDVFTNLSNSTITVPVRVVGNLGSDAATTVFATSDGDNIVEPADWWFGTDDGDGTGAPAVIHLIHGPHGLTPSSVAVIEDNVDWTYNLTVFPGETKRLATFTILDTTRANAVAAVSALINANGFGGEAAAFLTSTELASLANFQFNHIPTDVALSSVSVAENQPPGAAIGTLTTVDPDVGNTFSYSLVTGTGSIDNASFEIVGDTLKTTAVFNYETKSSYSIRVRSTDQNGLYVEKVFTISVTNVTELGGIDTQLGQTQRSYVRYLDVLFDRPDDIMSMVNNGRFQLTKMDLNGLNPSGVALSPGMFSAVGNSARLDFGVNGLGGNRNTTAGDGYYELGVDMDGNGSFESKKYFYRLLGDVNGDRKVDSTDSSLVTSAFGTTNANRDVNGDGTVNANDRTLLLRSVGRKLKDDLFADD